MKKKPLIYLASPYTHACAEVMDQRFIDICKVAGVLMREGKHLFCPIAMSAPIQKHGGTPGTWEYWEEYDTAILEKCDELCVVMLDGWLESTGVQAEIDIAHRLKMPVTHLDPYDILDEY